MTASGCKSRKLSRAGRGFLEGLRDSADKSSRSSRGITVVFSSFVMIAMSKINEPKSGMFVLHGTVHSMP